MSANCRSAGCRRSRTKEERLRANVGLAPTSIAATRAAIDVGTNPTFGTEPLHAEAFLLDYDGDDLRGEPLALEFWKRLRGGRVR